MAAAVSALVLWGPFAQVATAAPSGAETPAVSPTARGLTGIVGPDEVALSVIVPITAPATTTGLLDAEQLAQLTAPLGELSRTLDALDGVPVTLAIDPAIPASVAALGSDAPTAAIDWVNRLSGWETFGLLYADADPTLLTQSSLGAVPASAEPTGRWTPAADGLILTSPDTVVASDIPKLATHAPYGILVWSSQLADTEEANAVAAVDRERILIVDAEVSARIGRAAANGTLTSVRTAIDRDTIAVVDPAAAAGLRDVLTAIDADPRIAVVPLVAGISAAEVDDEGGKIAGAEVTIVDRPQDPERVAAFNRLVAEDALDARFAQILDDPLSITAPDARRTLALASRAWVGDASWLQAIEDETRAAVERRGLVRIVESDSLFLADRSSLPVSIENGLDEPITVDVRVKASNPRLDLADGAQRATVAPDSQSTVHFDAVAVSNGTVRVTVTLAAPDGESIGHTAVASVNVQAGWETPIVLTAIGLLAALLVVGIIRTIRRNRRGHGAETSAIDQTGSSAATGATAQPTGDTSDTDE